jgi:protein-disulfide isomerase
MKKYLSFFIVFLIGALVGFLVGKYVSSTPSEGQDLLLPSGSLEPEPEGISIDDDPFKGSETAPVTMIEFSDFQCPFCARFYTQTLSLIEENYIKTGKVKLVYRDFPLSFHRYAQKAAEAAECADEQGKFWEYHDLLYEKQNEWSALGISKLKDYAGQVGLNIGDFNQCFDSGKMTQEVEKDSQDGQSYGVKGTPAFFINGKLVSGAQPFEVFQAEIEDAFN